MFANVGVSFARPDALLLLLLLLPAAVYLSRTSLALLRRGRRRLSLALRLLLIVLLVLSLSGVQIVTASNRLSVVFLLDRSDSVSAQAQAQQETFVRDAIARMGANDAAGVVMFGADALVDRPVSTEKASPDFASAPPTTFSNLADAIRLGTAVAPGDTERRLVLLSDGRENTGSAEWAARLSAASGVPVDVVPLPTQAGPEVWIDSLQAPTTLREQERPSLDVTIKSRTDTTATLSIYVDGVPLAAQPVKLVAGANNFVQHLPPADKGFHVYSASIDPAPRSDTRSENNRYSAYSLVLGKPRVLVVEGHQGEAAALRAALSPSVDAQVVNPASVPASLQSLAQYEGIILVNVPASALDQGTMQNVQSVVRDLGKGLVVVGGDESYAAGGYFRTPIEQMLPVDLHLPSKLDIPTVAMVLVIDRSGSMGEAHSLNGIGITKLELAKEAAYRAVAQLSEKDYVGVVAFDSAANWIVDLQLLGDPRQFKNRIGSISLGGGTNIYSGLAPAVDALAASKAKSKHIVLLTDGQSEGGDYDGLLKKMAANSITLSTVGIGADADQNFLQSMASKGQGRYYYTEKGDALPEIFAHESHIAARSYLIEHLFTPGRTSPSQILDGLGGLPALQGYIGTSPRQGGQVVLVSDAGDPLLAQWQYGLGRVVAWTSDAKGQWAKDWVGWPQFAQFWSQAVGWSTGAQSGGDLQSQVALDGQTGKITVDAASPGGEFLNGLNTQVSIVAPGATTSTVSLEQTAAGRYEGQFKANEEGVYLLHVVAAGTGGASESQTFGVVVPYSPEYRGSEGDDSLLPRVASLTGGRVLSLNDVAPVFQHNLAPVRSATPLWPLLLLLAILLLPFDIGVRRVAIFRSDLARAWAAVSKRLGIGQRKLAPARGSSTPDMASLFAARQRTESALRRDEASPRLFREDRTKAEGNLEARELQITGRTGRQAAPSEEAAPRQQEPSLPAETPGDDSLAARLRKAREERR